MSCPKDSAAEIETARRQEQIAGRSKDVGKSSQTEQIVHVSTSSTVKCTTQRIVRLHE